MENGCLATRLCTYSIHIQYIFAIKLIAIIKQKTEKITARKHSHFAFFVHKIIQNTEIIFKIKLSLLGGGFNSLKPFQIIEATVPCFHPLDRAYIAYCLPAAYLSNYIVL